MCERLIEGRRQINVFNYDWKYFYTISFITALCILCFIASFRADIIGADHINYIYEYKNINKTGNAYFSEKGYVLLCRIISELSQCNIAALNFSVAALTLAGFYCYIKKYVEPDYYILALIILVFNPYMFIQSTFNIMRQGCAIGILLLSLIHI